MCCKAHRFHCNQLFATYVFYSIDRDRFQLGSLSHTLNTKASGYLELSDWPEVAPDPSVRNVEVIEPVCTSGFLGGGGVYMQG